MASMHFISTLEGRPPKLVRFDSSPGRAIAQALGDLDEKSYSSELKEDRGDEQVYEIHMRKADTELHPGPHPLKKVGILTYHRPADAPAR